MSTTHTPPPDTPQPPPVAPERRCPRCGSALAPDQEWCLACGAAADTEIAEPTGWRVPIVVGGGLVALAVVAILLVIFALARGGKEQVAQTTPTPTPSVAPATPTPVPSLTPTPTVSTDPNATPTTSPDPNATPTTSPDPNATATASPDLNATPTPTPTTDTSGNTTTGGTGSTGFTAWPGGNGWTIIIESATNQSKADKVATSAQDKGETVGILHSDDFSSLNAGYWVVFTQKYDTQKQAQAALSAVRATHKAAYVRQVKS